MGKWIAVAAMTLFGVLMVTTLADAGPLHRWSQHVGRWFGYGWGDGYQADAWRRSEVNGFGWASRPWAGRAVVPSPSAGGPSAAYPEIMPLPVNRPAGLLLRSTTQPPRAGR